MGSNLFLLDILKNNCLGEDTRYFASSFLTLYITQKDKHKVCLVCEEGAALVWMRTYFPYLRNATVSFHYIFITASPLSYL